MERKVIITRKDSFIYTSLIEDGIFTEIHVSSIREETAKPGDLYIGRVKKINQNIGAAFIEIAPGCECYCSLEQLHRPVFTKKIGKKPLCIGDELIVQVTKEAAKGKAASVTSEFDIAGNYAVLTHGNSTLGVSNKVPPVQKSELKLILEPFKNNDYGFIIRTNAMKTESDTILAELESLKSAYKQLIETASHRVCYSVLRKELPDYLISLRNVYTEGLTEIVIEDPEIYEQARQYLEQEKPEFIDLLRKYQDRLLPLQKVYNIDQELQRALAEKVWLKNGGFLIIQPTEALTVIDVNSGKCIQGKDQEKTFLRTNLEAAKEAARQIRLRNISGIIIIDFINMNQSESHEELLRTFRKELAKDPVQTALIDVTKLQLVEVTRRKVRMPLAESMKGMKEFNG